MEKPYIQKRLFEEIQKNLLSQYLLVDIVSDVLDIGKDSAYRRIRGEKQLNIDEAYKLCKHFHLSLMYLWREGPYIRLIVFISR
jgi:hypothetical protein